MTESAPTRTKVFISYANADSDWAEKLKAHLDAADSKGLVEYWTDQDLKPGDNWKEKILNAIKTAKIAVLLLSPDFFASESIVSVELPIIKQAVNEGAQLLPIIVKPIEQMSVENEIAEHKFLNDQPIAILPPRDQERVLIEASKKINEAILSDPFKRKISSGLSTKMLASAIGGATAATAVSSVIGGLLLPGIGSLLFPIIGAVAGGGYRSSQQGRSGRMIINPNLLSVYVGLAIGLIFALFTLIRYRRAPEFTEVTVIILSTAGAIIGIHLGYLVVTIDDAGLGKLAEHRLPVVLGALAVVWTAVGSLCKTCRQSLDSIVERTGLRSSR